ncbi:MAG: ABC transporter substrate-binding protein [Acetobacteraceae bacterium]
MIENAGARSVPDVQTSVPGRRRILAGAGTALGLAFLPRLGRASALEKVTLRLDWTPWGEQAAYHLAKSKGWYEEAGVDVRIEDGYGSTSTVQIVANDSAVDVGDAALSSMMVDRNKGEPLKAMATYERNTDLGVMVPNDGGIKTVQDLRGKRIGYTASSLEGPFVDTFLAKGGLSRNDCHLFNMSGGAKLGAYIAGRLDGAFSAVTFFLPAVAPRRPSHAVLAKNVGITFPSYGLFATEHKIATRRDALTRLVSVSSGAWAYIADGHEAEGAAAIRRERPQAKLSDSVMLNQIKMFLTFFPTPATTGKPVGWQALADWAAAARTLAEVKLLPPDSDPKQFYTNALLDEAIYRKVASGR